MGNSVCDCSRQGKGEISEIVLDGVLEKAEVRSLANPYLFNRSCSFYLRFDKIKEFETAFRSGSTANERFKMFHLKNRIETSGFKYYRQISCKTGYFPCISCECRDISKAIHQVQEFAFSSDADYW